MGNGAAMEGFDVGRTVSRAAQLVRHSLLSAGLLLLLVTTFNLGVEVLMRRVLLPHAPLDLADPLARLRTYQSGWYWASVANSLATASLSFAGAAHGMLKAEDRRHSSFVDCVSAGLSHFFPALAILLIFYVGMFLGLLLLVVPGVLIAMMWSVAIPSLVGENLGVFESLDRSRELTRGSRGKIFLIFISCTIAAYATMIMGFALISGGYMQMATTSIEYPFMFYGVQLPLSWGVSMFLTAVTVSVYLETLTTSGRARTGHFEEVFS